MTRWRKRPCRIDEAHALLAAIALEHGIDVEVLRGKGRAARKKGNVAIRREFIARGIALKIMKIELAIVLNRDHTTVTYHASAGMQHRKKQNRKTWRQKTERLQRGGQHAEVS